MARCEAAERAEQCKKKKAIMQQKAARRKQADANSTSRRTGKLLGVFILFSVLTVVSNYQSLMAILFDSMTPLLAAIPQ
jgi:uncharacterized membrane protein